jgi:hypothetical protein
LSAADAADLNAFAQSVPEPRTLGLLMLVTPLIGRRRRRA